jgi:hypothetical protein
VSTPVPSLRAAAIGRIEAQIPMETLCAWARRPLDFQWRDGPFSCAYPETGCVGRDPYGVGMLDIVMLAIGVGVFALLIGYVALCERL